MNLERASSFCSSVSHTEVVNLLPHVPDDTHPESENHYLGLLSFSASHHLLIPRVS